MKVKATNKYEELNVKDSELERVPKQGEKFEISEERYEVLTKTNKFNVAFVEKSEEAEVEEQENKVITKKTSKTTRKKK